MAFIFLNSVYLKSFQLSVLNSVAAEIVVIQCENWAAGWLAVPAVEATLPSPTPSLYGAAINFSWENSAPPKLSVASYFFSKPNHNQVQPETWLRGWVFYGKWHQKVHIEISSNMT